jgi:hypothetical protein
MKLTPIFLAVAMLTFSAAVTLESGGSVAGHPSKSVLCGGISCPNPDLAPTPVRPYRGR